MRSECSRHQERKKMRLLSKSFPHSLFVDAPVPSEVRPTHEILESLVWLSACLVGQQLAQHAGLLLFALCGGWVSPLLATGVGFAVLAAAWNRRGEESEELKLGLLYGSTALALCLGYASGHSLGSGAFVAPLLFAAALPSRPSGLEWQLPTLLSALLTTIVFGKAGLCYTGLTMLLLKEKLHEAEVRGKVTLASWRPIAAFALTAFFLHTPL